MSLSKELFSEYFDCVKRRLSFPQKLPPPGPDGEVLTLDRFGSLVGALRKLLFEVRTAGQCVKEARLGDLTAEAVEKIIRLQVRVGGSPSHARSLHLPTPPPLYLSTSHSSARTRAHTHRYIPNPLLVHPASCSIALQRSRRHSAF